jgi:hypothetical protein
VGFLRRLLGGGEPDRPAAEQDASEASDAPAGAGAPDAAVDQEERARELELARFDQDRIDDLIRRQQRYADRSWTPAAQGTERRADDGDSAANRG